MYAIRSYYGNRWEEKIGADGMAAFQIENPADYIFLKYTVH